jgi:hypothetical protein
MVWMGAIGFIDDYLKKIKKNKDGLSGIFKIIGQVGLGLIVGVTMYFHPDITIKRKYADAQVVNRNNAAQNFAPAKKETISTVPFMKNNEFDYSKILFWMDEKQQDEWAWLVFIPLVIFIVTAVSNGDYIDLDLLPIYVFDDDFISKIKTNTKYTDNNLRNIIIYIYNGVEIDMDAVELEYEITADNFYLIPIIIHEYRKKIENIIN